MTTKEETLSSQKRKVLITGVAGFVGAHLADFMLSSGLHVVGIDNLNPYYSTQLKTRRISSLRNRKSFEFHQMDLCDYGSVEKLIQGNNFSSIFHLAAQAGVRIPVGELKLYSTNNLTAFSNILELAVKYKITDFLFASSSSVYGNDAKVPFSETEQNLNPSSFYGATKLCNEILTRSLVAGTDTRARGLRFFTVYGPAGRPDMAYFRLIASCVVGVTFNLNGDGEIKRDFTYVGDVVRVVAELETELKKKAPGSYDLVNVGGGNPVSVNELTMLISELTGKKPRIIQSDAIPSDAGLTFAGNLYLESLIGKVPTTRLEEGLPQTIEWAIRPENINNLKNWIESVK